MPQSVVDIVGGKNGKFYLFEDLRMVSITYLENSTDIAHNVVTV